MPHLTRAMAEFIHGLSLDNIPGEIVEKARVCLLNGYGIALGCLTTPYAPVARSVAMAIEGVDSDGATMLGDGRKTGLVGAMLANSALFHGRAQEDTCGAAHLGAIAIPALTAITEARKLGTQRLLPALVAAYECGGLLESAYGRVTTPIGLRATPLYGVIAAAAGAGYLLGLTVEQLDAALANAASFAGGILQSFAEGTDEWRYQVGMAGTQGVIAVELARAGSVSASQAIEGKSGFARAFVRMDCDVDALIGRLGQHWSTRRVTFKPFPVCAFNQTPVTAALTLREEIAGRPIKEVTVAMNPFECGYAGMDSKGPFRSISGTLMSIPFCIATTLLRGVPTMPAMTTYDDAAVNDLVSRTNLVADPDIATLCCNIDVTLVDGQRIRHREIKTTDDFAFDWARISSLVRRVGAESGIPDSVYSQLERFVRGLPDGDISQVIGCFAERGSPGRAAA